MEEAKLQALHDTLSKLKGGQGLGTANRYSWQKAKPTAATVDFGLPSNALYANFVPEGALYDPKGGARDDGDGRYIKRDFSSDSSDDDDDDNDERKPATNKTKMKTKKKQEEKLSKEERKAQKKEAKRAEKLAAKKKAKLEAKRLAKRKRKRGDDADAQRHENQQFEQKQQQQQQQEDETTQQQNNNCAAHTAAGKKKKKRKKVAKVDKPHEMSQCSQSRTMPTETQSTGESTVEAREEQQTTDKKRKSKKKKKTEAVELSRNTTNPAENKTLSRKKRRRVDEATETNVISTKCDRKKAGTKDSSKTKKNKRK